MRITKRPTSLTEKRARILYVEDDDLNWTVMKSLVGTLYDIVRARGDEEFYEALRSGGQFDLILMDIELAGSKHNGIELVSQMRGSGRPPQAALRDKVGDTPVIFVTAYSGLYNRDQLLGYGADEVTFKPINPTSLKLLMSRLLMQSISRKSP